MSRDGVCLYIARDSPPPNATSSIQSQQPIAVMFVPSQRQNMPHVIGPSTAAGSPAWTEPLTTGSGRVALSYNCQLFTGTRVMVIWRFSAVSRARSARIGRSPLPTRGATHRAANKIMLRRRSVTARFGPVRPFVHRAFRIHRSSSGFPSQPPPWCGQYRSEFGARWCSGRHYDDGALEDSGDALVLSQGNPVTVTSIDPTFFASSRACFLILPRISSGHLMS
jgi:hypothetical protein